MLYARVRVYAYPQLCVCVCVCVCVCHTLNLANTDPRLCTSMSRVVLFVRWELGRHEHTQCDQKVSYNPTIVALVMLMCVLGLPPFQRTDCALFSLFVCVQACFSQREKAYQAWQIAQTNLIKKREQEGKLQAAGNTEKVKLCQEEIVQVWCASCSAVYKLLCVVHMVMCPPCVCVCVCVRARARMCVT